jgi:HAD superfamily hydrolase (TIGR01549 family)
MIETVFLDAGGVLVWPNWNRVADALRAHGIDVDPAALFAADAPARYALDEAHVRSDQQRAYSFFELALAEAGVPLSPVTEAALADVRAYHHSENLWEIVPDFVVPALRRLREAKYKLVVVSNANGRLHHLFDRLGLTPHFDVIVDSHVEGVEKPDRRLFEAALARSASSPETTVHVGDFYNVDVAGARGAGLTPVLVDEAGLHAGADCARIRSIAELPALLESMR